MESQQPKMNDIISRCTTSYTNTDISAVRASYSPGENIDFNF